MSVSIYNASVPGFVRQLTQLSEILKKAEAYAAAKSIDPSVFTNGRLAPDMFPLSRQIQIATDSAKGCAARLAGIDVPSYPDTETTFPELQERIQKTIAFVKSVDPAKFEGAESRTVTLKLRGQDTSFVGAPYLFGFVLPNFYFHVTTSYAILRHLGLDIGKADYLGSLDAA